ncbi:MAG: alpha/beta fold hydrolase [Chloroflexi bacterium]|nr:alpha/beta fold hydrolase [Chloroflexota bacterium]
MSITERVVRFGPGGALVGVVTHPPGAVQPGFSHGVLLLSAGLVHRVGPNRLYVSLARDLAAMGLPVLRFDFAGLGDSARRDEQMALESSVLADVDDALAFMRMSLGVDSCTLVGHCSGAFLACYVAQQAAQVRQVIALNYTSPLAPDWTSVDREEKAARLYFRYYLDGAMKSREKWRRFLSGQVSYRRISSNLIRGILRGAAQAATFRLRAGIAARLGRSAPLTSSQAAEASPHESLDLERLLARGVGVSFVFSEQNPGRAYVSAKTAGRFDALVRAGRVGLRTIPESDHGFSSLAAQRIVRDAVRQLVTEARTPASPQSMASAHYAIG